MIAKQFDCASARQTTRLNRSLWLSCINRIGMFAQGYLYQFDDCTWKSSVSVSFFLKCVRSISYSEYARQRRPSLGASLQSYRSSAQCLYGRVGIQLPTRLILTPIAVEKLRFFGSTQTSAYSWLETILAGLSTAMRLANSVPKISRHPPWRTGPSLLLAHMAWEEECATRVSRGTTEHSCSYGRTFKLYAGY